MSIFPPICNSAKFMPKQPACQTVTFCQFFYAQAKLHDRLSELQISTSYIGNDKTTIEIICETIQKYII